MEFVAARPLRAPHFVVIDFDLTDSMSSQLPRSSAARPLPPAGPVQKAQVTEEVQELLKTAMMAPSVPVNFIPPVPPRPEQFPNIRIEDHAASHQASVLQIRRPMSADMAKWVVSKLEQVMRRGSPEEQRHALQREVPSHSMALEFRDACRNLKREVPEALTARIAELKKPKHDRELKLETRAVYGPAVVEHADEPSSNLWTGLPAVSGRTHQKWDQMCRRVHGETIGLGALLAPATLVYNNMHQGATNIRTLLAMLKDGDPPRTRCVEGPDGTVVEAIVVAPGAEEEGGAEEGGAEGVPLSHDLMLPGAETIASEGAEQGEDSDEDSESSSGGSDDSSEDSSEDSSDEGFSVDPEGGEVEGKPAVGEAGGPAVGEGESQQQNTNPRCGIAAISPCV